MPSFDPQPVLSPRLRFQFPVGSQTGLAALLAAAVAVAAVPLAAQQPTYGADINAAGETARDRAPIFFGSTLVAPDGYKGLTITAIGTDRRFGTVGFVGIGPYEQNRGVMMGGIWGLTPRLTVGLQAGYAHEVSEVRVPVNGNGFDLRAIRREYNDPLDLRLYGRYLLLGSGDGATKVALNASLARPTLLTAYGTMGLAVSRRVGRVSLHLAPELVLRDGRDAARVALDPAQPPSYLAGRTPFSADLKGGIAVPITRRVSWTLEGIASNLIGSANRQDYRVLDGATGLRLDLGRARVDLGWLHTSRRLGGDSRSPIRDRVILSTHWRF